MLKKVITTIANPGKKINNLLMRGSVGNMGIMRMPILGTPKFCFSV